MGTHPRRTVNQAATLHQAHDELVEAIVLLRNVSTFASEVPDNAHRLRLASHHIQRAALALDGIGRTWIGEGDDGVPDPAWLPWPLGAVAQVWTARRTLALLQRFREAVADDHQALEVDEAPLVEPGPELLPRPLAEAGLGAALCTVFIGIGAILYGAHALGIAAVVLAFAVFAAVMGPLS